MHYTENDKPKAMQERLFIIISMSMFYLVLPVSISTQCDHPLATGKKSEVDSPLKVGFYHEEANS